MKKRLWQWIIRSAEHPEGKILPRWLFAIKAALFPLDWFYWKYGATRGYQWESDTWLIHGVRYSDSIFQECGFPTGMIFRVVKREGDLVTIQRYPELEDIGK